MNDPLLEKKPGSKISLNNFAKTRKNIFKVAWKKLSLVKKLDERVNWCNSRRSIMQKAVQSPI